MGMNIKEAMKQTELLIEEGQAVLLTGGSGLAKSSGSRQLFRKIKARDAAKGIRWGLGVVFLATQNPMSMIGFEFKGEKDFGDGRMVTVTEQSVPLWFLSVADGDDPGGKPAWMYDKFFLIIDEYGQGDPDTKKAGAEIFLNGGTPPWYLPPGSARVACSNTGSRYGVTKDFYFSVARRTELQVVGDIACVLEHWDKPYEHQGRIWQVMGATKAFAKQHPETIFEKEPAEITTWCNPRTMLDVDRYMQVVAEHNNGVMQLGPEQIAIAAGTMGMPGTQAYFATLQSKLELPSYEDVIADPVKCPVPQRPDLLLLMAYELANWTRPQDLAACITYMQRMPKDMAITYISALVRRDYKNTINHPAVSAWLNKNAALMTIVVGLAQN